MDNVRYDPSGTAQIVMDQGHDPENDRDANIFALGDAAANLDEDIDDLFAGFGIDLRDIVKDGSTRTVTKKTLQVPDNAESAKQKTVEISTISRQLDDGRRVHTKIIRGPVKCTKKLIKISRETPHGLEILSELEVPGEADVNSVLATELPKSLGLSIGSVDADYDNLDPEYGTSFKDKSPFQEDDWVGTEEDLERARRLGTFPLTKADGSQDLSANEQSDYRQTPPRVQFRAKNEQSAELADDRSRREESPLISITDTSESENWINQARSNENNQTLDGTPSSRQNGDLQTSSRRFSRKKSRMSKRRASQNESLRRKSLAQLADEEAIQLYQPPETEDEESESDDSRRCLVCTGRSRKKNQLKNKNADTQKKGGAMTALHPDKEISSLPGIKQLVANYAKMLYEDRPQFVDTMFRAVKLNNVDVSRILCKIVLKSRLKLSQFDLREPESSATILHVALLYNYESIVRMLLSLNDKDLIVAKYESYEYRNQTGLHLAVANENPGLIASILTSLEVQDRVALINTIANGKYFRTRHPDGQLCLTVAAWAGNDQVIKTLVKYGGDLGLKNSIGNTLLHSIILQSIHFPERGHYERLIDCVWEACDIKASQLTVMYEAKFQKQKELKQKELQEDLFRELLKVRNDDGYTPLALAVTKLSRLFKYLINMEKIFKIPQNKLGSIAWVTYDVTDISSFAQDKYNKFSVLHILAHNSQQLSRHANLGDKDNEDFLEMEPISTILTNKWRSVYRWIYIFWLIIHISYMVVFTVCTIPVNSKPKRNPNPDGRPVEPQLWFIFFMILPSIYMLQECLDIGGIKPYRIQFMSNQNIFKRCMNCLKSEWTITGNGPYRLVNFGFSSFTLQWFILYLDKDERQDIALAMSLLLGWIFVLFFTRACRVTCRFTIMIQKMFFRDLIYFLTVYGIILVAFSFSMNALFTYLGDEDKMISKVFNDMMNVVTDLDTKQSTQDSRHPMFSKILLILYAIVAVILLMNMLIAMMNTSYETVRVTRCNLWKQQQLSIMLMLERRFFFIKYLCQKSESDTWRKEVGESREWRCFLDVTMLHQPGIKESEYVTSSVRTAERKTSSSGESDESAKAKASGV
ncbi:hypothetical protein LSH36_1309g00011 [Paralvinella palmiformis]|uniref:Uncharacterized protein n=1 Tax=Paralvinella palmiformis TaxID=53620 RepID=A0AAD9IU07_9ANNE|nr:hypothetical protein LSH36_1309g00011 [Paralvinella palmiformis]